MDSKEGEDGRERRDIVRGRARFLWVEADVSTEGGQSREVGSKESHRERGEERREASAREG